MPGRDVVWLQVPFSALPGRRRGQDTSLPDGRNYGFARSSMRVVANRQFAEQHPAAAQRAHDRAAYRRRIGED